MLAVKADNLSKSYGDFECLRACNLEVPEGCVFGLLGPNGAGKSTLLRTLLGYLKVSSGSAEVCGYDVSTQSLEVRKSTAYLPGDARLYRAMKGRAVLDLFAGLHPHSTLESCLAVAKRLELDTTRRVMFMSTGMRQKLALSIVLGCRAPLVILDEPTANLDPNVRSTVLELVREVRDDGRTVVLSSHIFSDIDETCDQVAILRRGEFVAEQEMASLDQLHVVNGEVEAGAIERVRYEVEKSGFVRHLISGAIDGDESNSQSTQVELHLTGEPGNWLSWLSELGLSRTTIEKSGIRTIYQQFHSGESLQHQDGTAR